MTPIPMKLANATQKDTDTALAIGGVLNDLDDCNSAFRHCSIRTLEFIDDPDTEEEAENPLEDFDPKDGEHCKILVERLLKLLDRSPGCLNRVLWGYSSIRGNNLIDLDSNHLTFHPEIVAAKKKATQLEWLWKHCKIIFFPPSENSVPAYPIEHAPLAQKDARALIEAFITPSDPTKNEAPSTTNTSDALQLALRSLQFFVDQCRGDSGTGESHWEQFPEYRQAVSLLRLCTTGPVVAKTEVHDLPTPANLVQVGDLWVCEDEDSPPYQIPFTLLIQCSSAEQCRTAMKAGTIQFTQFAHYTKNEEPGTTNPNG